MTFIIGHKYSFLTLSKAFYHKYQNKGNFYSKCGATSNCHLSVLSWRKVGSKVSSYVYILISWIESVVLSESKEMRVFRSNYNLILFNVRLAVAAYRRGSHITIIFILTSQWCWIWIFQALTSKFCPLILEMRLALRYSGSLLCYRLTRLVLTHWSKFVDGG